MLIRTLPRRRMTAWREYKWSLAQKFIGWVIALAGNEMSRDTLEKFLAFQESFMYPDPKWDTVAMQPKSVADQFAKLVAEEVTTQDPAAANAAVVDEAGHVRLVVDRTFARDGDIVHVRGTPEFEQALRYWRIERSENEVRANTGNTMAVREYSRDPLTEFARIIGQDDPFAEPGVRHVVAGASGFTPKPMMPSK